MSDSTWLNFTPGKRTLPVASAENIKASSLSGECARRISAVFGRAAGVDMLGPSWRSRKRSHSPGAEETLKRLVPAAMKTTNRVDGPAMGAYYRQRIAHGTGLRTGVAMKSEAWRINAELTCALCEACRRNGFRDKNASYWTVE